MQERTDSPTAVAPLVPYVIEHGRGYDLSILEPAIGQALGEKVATVIGKHFGSISRDTAVTRWSAFRRCWQWLAASEQAKPFRVATKLGGRIASRRDLETVTHLWFDDYRSTAKDEVVTIAENVNHVGRCLDILADSNVFPRITRPRMPRNYHRSAKKRKSLAEVSVANSLGQIDIAVKAIRESVPEIEHVEGGDEYLAALASSVDVSGLRSAQDIARAIQSLNAARMVRLRQIAEERLLHWQNVYKEGEELRAARSKDLKAYLDQYLKADSNKVSRAKLTRDFFGVNLEHGPEELKRYFVSYVHEHCNGVCPRETDFYGGPGLFRRLAIIMGGRDYFKGWFGAHEDAVAAAVLIYLIDSGANISVALGLTLSCEEPCDEPGHVRISGSKNRAGQKPIVEILPVREPGVKVSAVEALRIIKTMAAPHRARDQSLSDHLFVHAFFAPTRLTDEVLANRLNYFCRDDQDLRNIKLLPSFIRPSVLLQATLESDGSILVAQSPSRKG